MLKLSREELEDIWNNKPYGYFTQLCKNSKNFKKFEVTAIPYKKTTYPLVKTSVYALKSTSHEVEQAKSDLRKEILAKYPNDTSIMISYHISEY
jgi:hypothetical protein